MNNNNIIIEFTWLQWSWKTTTLDELIKNKFLDDNFTYIWKKFHDENYVNKSAIKKIYLRSFWLLKNPILNLRFFLFSIWIQKWLLAFNWFSYGKYLINNIWYQNLITDEIILTHFSNSWKEPYDNLLTSTSNIFPIYFNISIKEHIKRTKKRLKPWYFYDKLPDEEKKKLAEKNLFFSQRIIKKYCELTNKPYLEVDWDASIEEKVKQVMNHIEYIKKINWL